MSEYLIKAENVSKKFCKRLTRSMLYGLQDIAKTAISIPPKTDFLRADEFWAVDDISFELKRGECLGLIGRNGCGKSTLLKMLNGIISPDKGKIEIKGKVGALIEVGAGFHPMLTGRENIYINGSILGFSKKEIDKKFDEIVEFSELQDFIDTPVKHYSSGMHVRLGFAIAAQMEPDVLLIDEILAVGDIGFKIKCMNEIKKIIQHSAVIFVSHTMQQISAICTKIMVLDKGKKIFVDNDIATGIDLYLNKFDNPKKNIAGNGKAVITEVQLYNGNQSAQGDERLPVTYGDDILIAMDLELLDDSIKGYAIRIIVWDNQQRPIVDCFSEFSKFSFRPEKQSKIKLTLNNLNLNMGAHSISVSVINLSNKETLCRYENVGFLQVKNTYVSWASTLLRGEWSQEKIQ